MDVGLVGAQYLEQNRYSVENLSIGRKRGGDDLSATGASFADYLERAVADKSAVGAGAEAVAADAAGDPSAKRGKPYVDKASKLYEQCEALETFLVKNLLTGMRNTVQKTGLIEEGFAGKMYEDMLWDEYAKDFSKNAGFGLAEQAYLELTNQRGKLIANHA
ncbi:MAG: rod-binding protein [Treponema sp.]|jgi:flagellar protein FlgJ|nr:rod-binding protein [Treponema sp.]